MKKEYRGLKVKFKNVVSVMHEYYYKNGDIGVDNYKEVRLTKKLFEKIGTVCMKDICNYYD